MFYSSTIKQLLADASTRIDRLDAEVFLAHVLEKPREFFISHDTDRVDFLKTRKFKKLVKKRQQNYPAAQLIGTKGFYGYDFEVNKHTLIPRPDTEMIVELAIQEIKKSKKPVTLIDVGTGSGCIPISILKNVKSYELQVTGYATDISRGALKVARRNAKTHGIEASHDSAHAASNINITFKRGNLLEPLLQNPQLLVTSSQLLITANLPYITEDQWQTSPTPEIHFEPKTALVADNHGLALYEELLQQLVSCYMLHVTCLFEIDPTQSGRMQTLVTMHFPNATIEVHKDLCGRERVVEFNVT